jgi:hypothetical protein
MTSGHLSNVPDRLCTPPRHGAPGSTQVACAASNFGESRRRQGRGNPGRRRQRDRALPAARPLDRLRAATALDNQIRGHPGNTSTGDKSFRRPGPPSHRKHRAAGRPAYGRRIESERERSAVHSKARWHRRRSQTFNISPFELGGLPGSAWAQSAIGAPPKPISLPVGIAVAHLPHPVARARPTGAARRRAAARWVSRQPGSSLQRGQPIGGAAGPGQGPSTFGTWAGSRAWVTSSAAFWTSL